MYDAVIIGAGMSGLAAGIRLAHFGRRVCILERHTSIGGLNSYYRAGGRRFDVGLHAMTNYRPNDPHRGPFSRLCRQLRLARDDFGLAPQLGSAVAFPGIRLEFTNEFEHFHAEMHRHFPGQRDNFQRLVAGLADYQDLGSPHVAHSARDVVAGWIDDPLLVEMIFCPILFYGGARPHDLDFGQFSILFRSIFMEGLARPLAGVRPILKLLVRKFKELGGELRLRSGVREIASANGRARAVVLDDGEELPARYVISSAGWRETMRLCGLTDNALPAAGEITFLESISLLDTEPRDLGLDRTVIFFNDSPQFRYARPDDPVDLHSGSICVPNNFAYDEPMREGCVRLTALANYDHWARLAPEPYREAKLEWYRRTVASAARFVPDFSASVVATDVFTPTTIRRYTGHENGAVYGCPEKRFDGRTHLENLLLCGTDHGFVGIVGTLVSGIMIVNRHVLKDEG
jgi:phytoene dehydrogenase-like protein